MKFFIGLSLALLSSLAFASTQDSSQFLYQGLDSSHSVNLSTEKTHTEYREVTVPSTCYRTEFRYTCRTTPGVCRTQCNRGRCHRVCSPPRRICQNIPVQIPYQCTRVERQPYEVLDFYVDSQIEFSFEGKADRASETFTVNQNGEDVNLEVASSKRYALVLKNSERLERMSGNTKFLDMKYFIELIDVESIKASLSNGLYDVSLSNGVFSFKVGPGFNISNFKNSIKLYRDRRLAGDILLVERMLANHEVQVTTNASEKVVAIDLKGLGVDLPSRLRVIFNTEYDFGNKELLNSDIKDDLKASLNYLFY